MPNMQKTVSILRIKINTACYSLCRCCKKSNFWSVAGLRVTMQIDSFHFMLLQQGKATVMYFRTDTSMLHP
jgi:hypothetical protein